MTDSRLATLRSYDILDTAPEAAFDQLVTRAKALCATPMASLTFVDADRQWFKAQIGLADAETPLDISVCAIAMRQGYLFQIEDLAEDPRTARMSVVTGDPHIRFYAGYPLRAPGGAPLGTLCVIDTRPRPGGLTADQREGLEELADEVLRLLEARRDIRRTA
jgi:GAF domain-containing protein